MNKKRAFASARAKGMGQKRGGRPFKRGARRAFLLYCFSTFSPYTAERLFAYFVMLSQDLRGTESS